MEEQPILDFVSSLGSHRHMGPDGLRECLGTLTKFGGGVGSPAALFMVGMGRIMFQRVKSSATVIVGRGVI